VRTRFEWRDGPGVDTWPMPWCDDCDRFYTPTTLTPDGHCPEGHQVAEPSEADGEAKVPWHFWLLVVALALYLGWRAVEGIIWLFS